MTWSFHLRERLLVVAAGERGNRSTADRLWQIDRAREDLLGLVRRINALVTERVPALYRRLDEHGVRPDPGEALEMPTRRGGGP